MDGGLPIIALYNSSGTKLVTYEYDAWGNQTVTYVNGGGGGGGSTGATSGSALEGSRTKVHHIVEQCQTYKSGFSNDIIQADSNKVELDYSVYRKNSGYYSSKPEWTKGLRVRDWLAGQSFEFQTKFGWQIVQTYRGD